MDTTAFNVARHPPCMRPRRDGTLASRGIAVALAACALAFGARSAANADPPPSPPPPSAATVPAAMASTAPDFTADIASAKELTRKGRAREAIALLAADYKTDPTNRDVAIALAQTYSYSVDP